MFRATQKYLGVVGLGKIISDYAPQAIEKKGIKDYYGKALALDASLQIFQVAFGQFDRSSRGEDHVVASRGIIAGVMYRVLFLLKNGITPVFVFDGVAPTQKADTQEFRNERRERAQTELALRRDGAAGATGSSEASLKRTATELPPGIFEDLVDVLKTAGIPVVEAQGESDPQMAALVKDGLVHGAATEDLDALAFGAHTMVRGMKPSALVGPENTWATQKPFVEYNAERVISGLKLPDQDSFIDLCILLGCDYSTSVPGVGAVGALNIAQKHHRIEKWLQSDDFLQLDAEHRLKQVFGKVKEANLLKIPAEMIEALMKENGVVNSSSTAAENQKKGGGVKARGGKKKSSTTTSSDPQDFLLPEETMERLFTRITEGAVQRVFTNYRPRFGVTNTERVKITDALNKNKKKIDDNAAAATKKQQDGEGAVEDTNLEAALATAAREWFSFVDSSPEALQTYLEAQQQEQQQQKGGEASDIPQGDEMFMTRDERKRLKKLRENKKKNKIEFSPVLWDTVNKELLAAQLHASDKIAAASSTNDESSKLMTTQTLALQAQLQLLNEVLSLNLIHETSGVIDACVYEAARESFKSQNVVRFSADQKLEVVGLRRPNLEKLQELFESHGMEKIRSGPILSRLAKAHPAYQDNHPSSKYPALNRTLMDKTRAASSLAFPLGGSLPRKKSSTVVSEAIHKMSTTSRGSVNKNTSNTGSSKAGSKKFAAAFTTEKRSRSRRLVAKA